jgi:hypothetical protein
MFFKFLGFQLVLAWCFSKFLAVRFIVQSNF